MEWLTAIGTGIVGKLAEYTVEPVIRQVGYVICYDRNLETLEKKLGDLSDARLELKHRVDTEERNARKIENSVQTWLTKVDKIIEEVTNFLNLKDENHACFCPNPRRRHWRSRKSTKMALDVAELLRQKDFPNIAYDVKPDEVFNTSITDYHPTDSRTSILKKIINELTHSNTDMIGVYGIGGVGKTTLAKEVYRQSLRDKTLFDDVVVILDVKQIPELKELQKIIAEKLGMEILGDESMDKRALRICERIKNKKVLVILDDIQERIDLEKVGLPRGLTCKVLLTSRMREVLSAEMGTQKEFPLDTLEEEETWCLFEKMAGGAVQNPAIREVATQVAQECGGLPVVIVTVASALKNKTALHNWNDALRRLKTFERKGFKEKAYLALEWSYEQLDEEELRPLFLLCGVMRENFIYLIDLLKYSMGLGLIKNVNTMEEARNALHSLVGKLQDSCLLLENTDDHEILRMHDLVHEVAIGIASKDQHVFRVPTGGEFKGWPNKDFAAKSTMIVLKQCNIPNLPEGMQCPELVMFYYDSSEKDQSLEIPNNYFEGMKKLRVLDLTLLSIPSLPTSLQFLKCLKTLCLDHCTLGDIALVGELRNLEILSLLKSKLEKLPKEIGQLTSLRLLDLSGCSQLQVIPPNVISRLKKLEELMMGNNSFNQWEAEGVIGTQRSNAYIEELMHLPHLTTLHIHIPDADILPADFFSMPSELRRFQICLGSAWKWEDLDGSLNTLKLKLTSSNKLDQGLKMLVERTEDLYLEGLEGADNSILFQLLDTEGLQQVMRLHIHNNIELSHTVGGKVYFPNLTWLEVSELNSSKFLLSSSMARSLAQLKHIKITGCQIMEAIVSMDEETGGNMFCQLQHLELKDLPNLTEFCSSKQDKFVSDPITKISLISKETEESHPTENPELVIQHFLFDNEVQFPNLKTLSINGLEKLTSIWSNQFFLGSSKSLESVEIVSCENLKSIFPSTVATSLQQLKSLDVESCGVEEIVSNTDGTQIAPVFDFPKLTYVRFEDLPQLRSFYTGSHSSNWPSLATLLVYNCHNVRIFKDGKHGLNNLYTPNEQFLFSFEKDSFPNLEGMGLTLQSWDNPPLHSFTNLKELYIVARSNSSIDSLEKLLGVSSGEIHAFGSGTLPHLRELELYGMRKLMHLGEDSYRPSVANFPNLEILVLEECDSLKNLRSSAISFKTLTTLQVSACKGLKYLITYSIAISLEQLGNLEVEDCEEMIEIVASSTEEPDSRNVNEFQRLKILKLSTLPKLRGFCSGTRTVRFPSLESIIMTSCNQLDTFIFDPKVKGSGISKEIERGDSKENYETEESNFLFDKKVELPSLKSLLISGAAKLTTVWLSQLAADSFCKLAYVEIHECESLINIFGHSMMGRLNALESLEVTKCPSVQVVFEPYGGDTSAGQRNLFECQNLQSVIIDSCESLKTIFPTSVARNLQQLKTLSVMKCGVENIIANEEGLQKLPTFVFPKVTLAEFSDLPKLKCFYSGMHVSSWPSLVTLAVYGCDKVDILAEEISSLGGNHEPTKQTLLLIEKDSSFPNMEWLRIDGMEIWNGPLPVKLFSKLKMLNVNHDPKSKSVVFFDKLQVDIEAASSSCAVGVGTHGQLPHLRELRLISIHKLMHLGEDDSQPSRPNFPYLEILYVNSCHNLRNLRSSAISFENLTTLEVSYCVGLKYLLTYSMAKSLTQLTKLEVEDCLRLEGIMGSNEVDDDSRDDITFRRLKILKLRRLPRLQGFCLGNRTVKFPSLETLSISNRLKLKIFSHELEMLQTTNEEEDTDVEYWDTWLAGHDATGAELTAASSNLLTAN